jgi:hypothetical protein
VPHIVYNLRTESGCIKHSRGPHVACRLRVRHALSMEYRRLSLSIVVYVIMLEIVQISNHFEWAHMTTIYFFIFFESPHSASTVQ